MKGGMKMRDREKRKRWKENGDCPPMHSGVMG